MTDQKYSQFDITIVGAGPSGSMLGYELAKKGYRVLILEKAKLPRDKVCAGGITVRAASLLPYDISRIVEDVIYGVRLSYNRVPEKVRVYEKPVMYMVMRERFDFLLATWAREAGVIIQDGVEVQHVEMGPGHVQVKTSLDTFYTPIVVGADGANSIVVKSLGLRKGFEYGLGINGYLARDRDKSAEWNGLIGLDYGIPGGYAWVFPKKECVSVGAGGSFREARKLKPYVMRLIQAYGLGPVDSYFVQGHLMPLRKTGTRLTHERILLVGDAAGMIDTVTGEGIYYGLKSSHLAAAAIINYLEGRTSNLEEYERAVEVELMPELRAARTIQKMNSATPRFLFHLFKGSDRVWSAFCRVLRGEKTYVEIKNWLWPPLRLIFRIL